MAAESEITMKMEPPTKKGLFGRMRLGNRNKSKVDTRDQTEHAASPKPETRIPTSNAMAEDAKVLDPPLENQADVANPDDQSSPQMKAVRFPAKDALKNKMGVRSRKELAKPPTAREAAYGGPPRYDWIDIETAAAIKVQSIVRRNQTMRKLEAQGITTAAIRNRSNYRKARMNARGASGSADLPGLFACCGVGLAFGDATEENYQATRQHEREEYLERKKEREAKEEELRNNFKKLEAKKKAARLAGVAETIEVVDE